jgi:hypothetical protein
MSYPQQLEVSKGLPSSLSRLIHTYGSRHHHGDTDTLAPVVLERRLLLVMSTYRGPINTNPGDGEASIIIYGYVPSLALGIVGAVAFFLALLANAWYALSQRGYRSFHTLLLVGCVS